MQLKTRLFTMALAAATLLATLAPSALAVSATGGNITTNYTLNGTNFRAHIFTTVGVVNLNVAAGGNVEVLVVAGGGGGGFGYYGGGGGAGGLIYSNAFDVLPGDIAVTVGAGGAGSTLTGADAANGSNSSFGPSLVANGGGGGASRDSANAVNGGSGGGAAMAGTGGTATQPPNGFGNAGASAPSSVGYGGGGGGAGAAAPTVPIRESYGIGGPGGDGRVYDISGVSNYYAGGGGGGSRVASDPQGATSIAGGRGGGGQGGRVTVSPLGTFSLPDSGTNNTGGGGGGGGNTDNGANGGSGIVIVRYQLTTELIIANRSATNVTTASAWMNGYLSAIGGAPISAVAVYWGTTDGGDPTSGLWAATNTLSGDTWTNGASLTCQATPLTENTTYYYRYYATNTFIAGWSPSTEHFLAGNVTVTNTDPVATRTPSGTPDTGTLTIQRDPSATNEALTVSYAWGGTAVQNVDYTLSPAGTNVTLPAWVASTNITITPLWAYPQGSKTVRLTLLTGAYGIGSPASNDVTITDYVYTPGANVTTNAGNWNDAIWSLGRRPLTGDDVTVTNAVLVSNATDYLNSFAISNATLTFTNWGTTLNASNVTIAGGGRFTMPAAFKDSEMSNNIVIACSNLTIDPNASIDATALGYQGGVGSAAGYGPGKGTSLMGAGYGGYGGGVSWSGLGGAPYGSTNAPACPGSGGGGYDTGNGGAGGGAVRIIATGTVTINGTLTANGGNGSGSSYGGGAAGGSIWISCSRLVGTSGVIRANGGTGVSWAGGGGGGRIAVTYHAAAQAAAGKPRIMFTAAYGANTDGASADYGTPGTLYFTDGAMLDGTWFPHSGRITFDTPEWSTDTLVLSNAWVAFPMEGFRLTVTNDVRIDGASGRLDIGGNVYWVVKYDASPFYYSSMTSFPSLNVGGNLTLTNGGQLYLYGGLTNAATPDYGALLSVTGAVLVAGSSSIVPRSHPFNGGSPLIRAQSITVLTNGSINAARTGYRSNYGPGHPGSAGAWPSGWGAGGGYGGLGGPDANGNNAGPTYGSSNAPIHPGSGGEGYDFIAGMGGGLVRIDASAGTVRIDGSVYAQGGSGGGGGGDVSGAGSGGGIYIRCRTFTGNPGGFLNAVGGSAGASPNNSGGGGRIAVWSIFCTYSGAASAANGTASMVNGQPGTIVWGQLPIPGMILMIR